MDIPFTRVLVREFLSFKLGWSLRVVVCRLSVMDTERKDSETSLDSGGRTPLGQRGDGFEKSVYRK